MWLRRLHIGIINQSGVMLRRFGKCAPPRLIGTSHTLHHTAVQPPIYVLKYAADTDITKGWSKKNGEVSKLLLC